MSNLMFFLFFFLSDVKNALLGRCQYRVTIKREENASVFYSVLRNSCSVANCHRDGKEM